MRYRHIEFNISLSIPAARILQSAPRISSYSRHERGPYLAIHRSGGNNPDGPSAWLVHDENRSDDVFGMAYADALKLARKAAPLLDITVAEFMRFRRNE